MWIHRMGGRLHVLHRKAVACALFFWFFSASVSALTVSFTSPGAQTWTVPDGVNAITVTATGGGGGGGYDPARGGNGGVVTATLTVTPGQTLQLFVGGGGSGSAVGGGGGGGSTNIDAGTAHQIIAGGGGGGASGAGGDGNGSNGGNGNGLTTGGRGGSGGIGGAPGHSTCCTASTTPGGDGNGGAGGMGGHNGGAGGIGSGTGAGGPGDPGNAFVGGGGGGFGGGGPGGTGSQDGGGGGGGSIGPAGYRLSVGSNGGAIRSAGGSGSIVISTRVPVPQAVDASAKATVMAQVSTATRFTDIQIANIAGHMNQLADRFSLDGNRFAIGFGSSEVATIAGLKSILLASADDPRTASDTPVMGTIASHKLGTQDSKVVENRIAPLPDGTEGNTDGDARDRRYAFWADGKVEYGRQNLDSGKNGFHTDGITLGLDFLGNPDLIIGAAIGYGYDRSDVDNMGSRVKGSQTSVSAYGIYRLKQNLLVDGILGFGRLDFDNSRYSSLASQILSSERKGSSTYGALGLSLPFESNAFKLKSYARVSYMDLTLDAYDEGSNANALGFDRMRLKQSAVFGGLIADYEISRPDGGKWIPNAKLELRHNSKASFRQSAYFADSPDIAESFGLDTVARNVQTIGLGVRYVKTNGMSMNLNWQGSLGSDSYRSSAFQASVSIPF